MSARKIPDAELLADLARVAALGPVTSTRYEAEGRYSLATLSNRFGAWRKAVARAGITPGPAPLPAPTLPVRRILAWTETQCVAAWRAFRWPHGPVCPRCDDGAAVIALTRQRLAHPDLTVWACRDCLYNFCEFSQSVFHHRARIRPTLAVFIMERVGGDLPPGVKARLTGLSPERYRLDARALARDAEAARFTDHLLVTLTAPPSREEGP